MKNKNMDKNKLRELFAEQKKETLIKNKSLIDKYIDEYNYDVAEQCDLLNDDITIEFCETKE